MLSNIDDVVATQDDDQLILQFLGHLASLPFVTNRTADAEQLFPDTKLDVLLECSIPVDARELFPPSSSYIAPPRDGYPINAGYLVIDFQQSMEETSDAIGRLAHTWWTIVNESSFFVTLVCVQMSPILNEKSRSEFVAKHLHFAFRAPAPLILVSLNSSHQVEMNATNIDAPKVSLGGEGEEAWNHEEDDYDYDYDYNWTHEDVEKSQYEAAEEHLYGEICAFLEDGPKEVQDLASRFAVRFNSAVRWNPYNEYSPDKKNDGSFKKWLTSRGFCPSEVYDRNKCTMSLPKNYEVPERKMRRRGKYLSSDMHEPELFNPPYGAGTPEAKQLQEEAISHVLAHGSVDMGALRQVNELGARFNKLFFHKAKVNDGSWKRWLASLPGLEIACDPNLAPHHGNQATMVRPKLQ